VETVTYTDKAFYDSIPPCTLPLFLSCHTWMGHVTNKCVVSHEWMSHVTHMNEWCDIDREIMIFIGKPKGSSRMISNATNPWRESRKQSPLRCAGSTSICEWLVCDLVVMCVQAVSDCALGDLCVCVRCRSVQSKKVWVCCNRVRHQGGSC